MRVMGLDVGDKTIGVAISDELGWTAQGLEVIRRTNPARDIARLQEIVGSYEVDRIVVGIPKHMNGTIGSQAEKVEEFLTELTGVIDLPVVRWDERLSTVGAERALLEANVSRAKRKKVIDKMAAVFILQGFLDSK